jgi:ribose transport system permease protein
VFGSLIGALMIATLNNGMDLLGISSFYQMVFKGLIIILAVAMDRNQREA